MSGKSEGVRISAMFFQCFLVHRGRTSSNEPGNRSSRNREKNPKHSWFTGSNPDAVQSTGCSPDHRPDGVRKVSQKIDRCNVFFHRGRTSSNEPGNRSSRNREKKNPKHSNGSPDRTRMQCPIDLMQSGPKTDWMDVREGVRKIDRCNVFFIGAEPRVMNQEIDRAETEKNPKHSWFTGSNPDAVQSTGCSPDHRPDGVRKVSGKSIGEFFHFIGAEPGAEPRVVNQEIDRAETEKKTRVIRSRVGFEARTS